MKYLTGEDDNSNMRLQNKTNKFKQNLTFIIKYNLLAGNINNKYCQQDPLSLKGPTVLACLSIFGISICLGKILFIL